MLYDRPAGVARITINRPERRNAMSWEVMTGLRDALAAAKADPEVSVVVLTGAGDEAFCAGADLGAWATGPTAPTTTASWSATESRGVLAGVFQDLCGTWASPPSPGSRAGPWPAASGLALACDLVVASDRARFGAPEINVGLWPYMITVPMVRSMPPKKALELMLTGRVVAAERPSASAS